MELKNKEIKKSISYALYKRSYLACYLLMLNKYSYIKKNGKVIILLDYSDIKHLETSKLSCFDVLDLHSVLLRENGYGNLKTRLSLYFPVVTNFVFLIKYYIHLKGFSSTKKNEVSLDIELFKSFIMKIGKFSFDRDLECTVILSSFDDHIDLKNDLNSLLENLNKYVSYKFCTREEIIKTVL